jgi:hypothetical protein
MGRNKYSYKELFELKEEILEVFLSNKKLLIEEHI